MSRIWRGLLQLMHLSRLAMVFAALSNTWLIVFLAAAVENSEHRSAVVAAAPLGLLLLMGAMLAIGLHSYGAALNDVLHARHDRMFRPSRPIPSGGLGITSAMVVAILSLLMAIGSGLYFGTYSVLLCMAAAAAIMLYNAAGRFLPATGIVTLGIVRALLMFIVNPALGFVWPVWLAMTHTIAAVAVVHRLEGRRPRLQGGELWALFAGWAFASLALIVWMTWRQSQTVFLRPSIWLGPLVVALLFIALTWWVAAVKARTLRSARSAGRWYTPLALAWLILYDACWLIGVGQYGFAAVHVVLFALACASMSVGQIRGLVGIDGALPPDLPPPPGQHLITRRTENQGAAQ